MTLTGSLIAQEGDLQDRLQAEHADVYQFLQSSQENGRDVVLISLGEHNVWQQWAVKVVYDGILEVRKTKNIAVLWQLPEESAQIPDSADKSIFFVASSIPQAEALNHPAVKLAMSHCEFGSTLECINAGVPVLAWPGSKPQEEQPANAKLLEDAGMAIVVGGGTEQTVTENNKTTYPVATFTVEQIFRNILHLLSDNKFQEKAIKLKTISKVSGGTKKAVRAIENAFLHYSTGRMVETGDKSLMEPTYAVD